MSRTDIRKKKYSGGQSNYSIMDTENFEPPQQASTPAKSLRRSSRKALQPLNDSILNISAIKKQDSEESKPYKMLAVINESYEYNRMPELFCSDPEDETVDTENVSVATTNDSDDKWTTLSDASENNCTNITDIMAEIDADVMVRFEKAPRRSYPGRKRNNKSLYENYEENEEEENIQAKAVKKDKKPKNKKKDPQEEEFIRSINEHFNEVENFGLAVE
ncbi:uncharacterized protein LOC126847408 [Adelges cooleyi]|uniref:uncharacterized protein LOC126847408 n=1 Tax=Adelges cooleyi TaxID=133065 RepID=UPI0021801D84|nr:uncharacterized protein LOC126847408 [Adelges cooleyi]